MNYDYITTDIAPLIQTDFTKMKVVCICKGCPNLKHCLKHFKNKQNQKSYTDTVEDFSGCCPTSNTNRSYNPIKLTFVQRIFKVFVSYFTKGDKKDTQGDESNQNIVDSDKGNKQRECKDKK